MKPLTPTNNSHDRCDRTNRTSPVRNHHTWSRHRVENVASVNHSLTSVSHLQQIVKRDSQVLRHIRRPSRPIPVNSWSPKPQENWRNYAKAWPVFSHQFGMNSQTRSVPFAICIPRNNRVRQTSEVSKTSEVLARVTAQLFLGMRIRTRPEH